MERLLGPTLLSKESGGSVATRAALDGAAVVGVYFSAQNSSPCRGFTPKLAAFFAERGDAAFKVVFASADRDLSAFEAYWRDAMPAAWLALPFDEAGGAPPRRKLVAKQLQVSALPTLVLVDAATGEVITTEGREGVEARPAEFPFRPKGLDELLSAGVVPEILVDANTKDAATPFAASPLATATHVGLYFSAHWCPPCRGFTPELVKYYNGQSDSNKKLEIAFCSSDRDGEAFAEYFASMPWLALPFENREAKEALSQHFGVRGIPTLVVLERDAPHAPWRVLTRDGRGCVARKAAFPDDWRPRPYGDIAQTVESKDSDINDVAALVVLAEGLDDADKRSQVVAAVQAFAETRRDDKDLLVFYATTDAGPVGKIRELTHTKPDAARPTVLKLDIPDNGAFYVKDDLDAVDVASLEAFLADVAASKVGRRQLGGGS